MNLILRRDGRELVNAVDDDGWTPLLWACYRKQVSVEGKKEKDWNARKPRALRSYLHMSVRPPPRR